MLLPRLSIDGSFEPAGPPDDDAPPPPSPTDTGVACRLVLPVDEAPPWLTDSSSATKGPLLLPSEPAAAWRCCCWEGVRSVGANSR